MEYAKCCFKSRLIRYTEHRGLEDPMRVAAYSLLVAYVLWSCATVSAMDCPSPPEQLAKDMLVETEASISGLKGLLPTGSLKNKTETTAKNLFEKYPNADRLSVAMAMISVYCQTIDDPKSTLSDKEKLDWLSNFTQVVMSALA